MKKTLFYGPANERHTGLFNEDAFPEFIKTLPGAECVQLYGDLHWHSSTYRLEPQGTTLHFCCDKSPDGKVVVELFGKPDTFSEIERKLFEEDDHQYLAKLPPSLKEGTDELGITNETRARWSRQAKRWVPATKRDIPKEALPLGFDPDDEHRYVFKIPG